MDKNGGEAVKTSIQRGKQEGGKGGKRKRKRPDKGWSKP